MTNDERRDMFAAAALTGLIERRPWPVDKNETATICYQFADAMLRERDATNHDAAPAAKAAEPARSPDQSPRGTGDTTRPTLDQFAAAIDAQTRTLPVSDPPPPTLTDAEREAVEWAIEVADSLAECSGAGTGGEPSREAATLRALLARLGDAT